ncbi:MAG: ThuA domain-containing protein [Verrucomicrobia bacterium]|nr:ThuA domain-containing protein [Verrucomicrobiota bacterium]
MKILLLAVLIALSSSLTLVAQPKAPKKMLVVSVTKGFRHSSIPTAEKVLGQIAEKSGDFTVDYVRNDKDMAEKMTMKSLEQYDGVIFANTTGDLPLPDKEGFLNWIKTGKAFVGMHSATDTFRGHKPLDPYVLMIGGEFKTHPPGLQQVSCNVENPNHPACKHLPQPWKIEDEIYILNGFERNNVNMLLSLDKYPGGKDPGFFPVAWVKQYGKGNIFYTSLGHAEAVWEDPVYQQHILGGIKWALGLEKSKIREINERLKKTN